MASSAAPSEAPAFTTRKSAGCPVARACRAAASSRLKWAALASGGSGSTATTVPPPGQHRSPAATANSPTLAPTSTTTSPAWTSKPGAAWYTRSRSTSACRNGRSERLTAHTTRAPPTRTRANQRRLAVNPFHSPAAAPRGAGRGGGPMGRC